MLGKTAFHPNSGVREKQTRSCKNNSQLNRDEKQSLKLDMTLSTMPLVHSHEHPMKHELAVTQSWESSRAAD